MRSAARRRAGAASVRKGGQSQVRQSLSSPSRLPAGRAIPAAAAALLFALLLALVSLGVAEGADGGLLVALNGSSRPWLTRLVLAATTLGT